MKAQERVVVYRKAPRAGKKDRSAGRPGYAPCSACGKHNKVYWGGHINAHRMLVGNIPCTNRKAILTPEFFDTLPSN